MAQNYKNFRAAVVGIASENGIGGFCRGWGPSVLQKLPSYVSYGEKSKTTKRCCCSGFVCVCVCVCVHVFVQ